MIVAAHQPNFAPWLGYFDKMAKADLFVSVDHVQLERQSFQTRARIKTGEGARWVTVPTVQDSRGERICDKKVDNSREGRFRWGRKMFLTLKYAYQAAPHFAEHEAALAELLDAHWDKLSDLNHAMIELLRRALDIRTPVVRSSQLRVAGAKSDMIIAMCREVGATAYLSGAGASKAYLDLPAFERAGIKVLWQEFPHPVYRQLLGGGGFIEKLSALDLLFNCGPEASRVLKGPAEPASSPARVGAAA